MIKGRPTLVVTSPIAETIINTSLRESNLRHLSTYLPTALASLEHEYTHAQGGVNQESGSIIGVSLEEVRAEAFSGDKLGYKGAKDFVLGYWAITGRDLRKDMMSRTKGGTPYELYAAIANDIGLADMMNVALALPKEYRDREDVNAFAKHISAYIGGFDNVLESLYNRAQGKVSEEAIQNRINSMADRLVAINKDGGNFTPDQYLASCQRQGVSFIAELIAKRATEILNEVSDAA